MAYGLDQFVKDIKITLKADGGPGGRKIIRQRMEELLQNKDFLAQALPPDVKDGHRKLYEDMDQGFVVLAHFHSKHPCRKFVWIRAVSQKIHSPPRQKYPARP